MDILLKVEDKHLGGQFSLIEAISAAWRTVGQKLGIQLDRLTGSNEHRLCDMLEKWIKEDLDLVANVEKYPATWSGLHSLLVDSGKEDIAKEFFEYLDKL